MEVQLEIKKYKILLFLVIILETFSESNMRTCIFEGQYFDLINQKCENCIENCRICDNNFCQECNVKYFLDSNYQCIEKCPQGEYFDNSTKKCTMCQDLNCQKCSFDNDCTECKEGFEFSQNKICIDKECKEVNGIYRKEKHQCSLDNNLLDESQKYSLNQIQSNNEISTFAYSSYGEDRQQDIKEINIYNVFGVFKVVACSNQLITVYDSQSMTILKVLDIKGYIYQTVFKDNSLLILVALNLSNKNDKYEYIQFQYVKLDLMTFVKQNKFNFDGNPVDGILTKNQIFLQYQKYVCILDLNDDDNLKQHTLQIDNFKIVSISYLQSEKVLLIQNTNAIYLTNQKFVDSNKLELNNTYLSIGKIISLSYICTYNKDSKQLIFYSIKRNEDILQNEVFFSIGDVIRFE